jgi:hypothetical protein
MRIGLLLHSALALLSLACSSTPAPAPSATGSGGDSGAPTAVTDASVSTSPPSSSTSDASAPPSSSGDSGYEAGDDAADACPAISPGTARTITGNLAFTTDDAGVPFGTQNGSTVHVATSDLVGKTLVWATAPGGEQIANLPAPTEAGITTIGADLTAHFTTSAMYTNGPWELAVFVSITGGNLTKGPQPGDLAGFDLTPPPACEPPVTGVSIRVTIDDANATVNLDNGYFIQF